MSVFNQEPHSSSERSISSPLPAKHKAEDNHSPNHPNPSSSNVTEILTPMQRLVERDLPFHQSSNSFRVRHHSKRKNGNHLYIMDWFHVLLRLRTIVSSLLFVAIWTIFLLLFAGIYIAVDNQNPSVNCGLGEIDDDGSWISIKFHGAFAFSLETTTTVGYGLPNSKNGFFENCPELQVAIYFQMVLSMFFNAFLVSFFFARMSRCERRAVQVLFSNKAILNREILPNGMRRYMLSTRIYDTDSMCPLVEAHVRFYAVKHGSMHGEENKDERHPFKMEPMRVSMPNDDLGAVIHTSIPSCATHHIDYHSPLLPPSKKKLGPEDGRVKPDSGFVIDPCGLALREHDSCTGAQDGLRCVICGETYGTVANLIAHILYNQHTEKHDDVPVEGSHQELDVEALFKNKTSTSRTLNGNHKMKESCHAGIVSTDTRIDIDKPPAPWYDEYRKYLIESNIEIICVMEAIDPITSGTFQAIQSYTLNDIEFDAKFAPCVLADRSTNLNEDGILCFIIGWLRKLAFGQGAVGHSVKIDLDSFHGTLELDEE